MPPLRPTKILPEGYSRRARLDLSGRAALLALNLAALILFVIFFVFFTRSAMLIHPTRPDVSDLSAHLNGLQGILTILAGLALFVVLHEGTHGIFFWLFTRQKPVFGLGAMYAYAAAPEWYLPRNLHAITALAPLVLLSALGMIAFLWMPVAGLTALVLCLSFNAAGSLGDVIAAAWVLTRPRRALIQDSGPACDAFTP
jgi:hypothetical protein